MLAVWYFLSAVGAAAGVTLLAILTLRRPLAKLLSELCHSGRHGDFWATLACLCTFLASTASAMLHDGTLQGGPADPRALLLAAVLQCAMALVGVLVSLFVIAVLLFIAIRRFERPFRPRREVARALYPQPPIYPYGVMPPSPYPTGPPPPAPLAPAPPAPAPPAAPTTDPADTLARLRQQQEQPRPWRA